MPLMQITEVGRTPYDKSDGDKTGREKKVVSCCIHVRGELMEDRQACRQIDNITMSNRHSQRSGTNAESNRFSRPSWTNAETRLNVVIVAGASSLKGVATGATAI